MSTVVREYERFMAWLGSQEQGEDVRRLANIMLESIQDMIPLGTAGRRRSKFLAPHAISRFEQAPIELPVYSPVLPLNELEWSRLYELEVGPFRGFVTKETFNLQKRVTLVYGANGAGKSSLCEALEYALLGEVSEADVKRIQGDTYLKNVWAGTYLPPTLRVLREDGDTVTVSPSEETYRFCFVEKNRIDAFSRLASRTPVEKNKLIATLFGIDQFANFVRGFNDDLDPQLDLIGAKAQKLKEAREALGVAVELIKTEAEREATYRREETNLASEFNTNINYCDLKKYIGTPEMPGRLHQITKELEKAPVTAIGITRIALEDALKELLQIRENLNNTQLALLERSSQISFQQLFNAVKELQTEMPDRCPACDTPLHGEHRVLHDPYTKSKEGLACLAELAVLQNTEGALKAELEIASAQLLDLLRKMTSHLATEGIQLPDVGKTKQNWWDALCIDKGNPWQQVLNLASSIEKSDELSANDALQRLALSEERDSLVELDRRILTLEGGKIAWAGEINTARELIKTFDAENQELIQEAEAERPSVELQLRIKRAYETFLPLLKSYLSDLPGSLLADLGETTKSLYNAFNREDQPDDQLAQLWLPTTPEEKIELSFRGTPTVRRDALQILSEGHIRCLGLSLLVAKNIKQGAQVLIFDDAVNAIDDDHRDGIWRTLFEDNWLGDKQVILTCHGQEFIKTIQQGLGAEQVRNDCAYYELLPHEGNHHPTVDAKPRTKNYVLSAQSYIARQDSRNALSESRRALEDQSKRLWKWLDKKVPTEIKLTYRSPSTRHELRDLCEQLKKVLTKPTFTHQNKDRLVAAMGQLLGIDGSSLEWSYLNSGTHDSTRSEFNRATVRCIVEAITEIDIVLS